MRTEPIVTIIIKNNKVQFFIHQRKSDKQTFPNLYGLGAGGKIKLDESKDEAAKRELWEETGLSSPIKFLFSTKYKDKDSDYPIYVYETFTNEQIKNHDREWQYSGWMTKKEVDKLLKENKLCPDTAIFYSKYLSEKY